ncbi:SRPBCC domain-containing protein [Arthrobacter castelli]|uniref:SRPBCC domain-containing protein n=1 Tax=Arthrobacter castelli TaxID=271431 RepID=UPI0003F9445D|nr:SRPBCC domain-containing protein [Arthrobacter castelli]
MSSEITVDRTDPNNSVLLLRRSLPYSATLVWQTITDPEELVHWFPCRLEYEPREGGRIAFLFEGEEAEYSRVTEFNPPRVFAFDWSGEHLRWTVEPDGDRSVLYLSNTILDLEWMPRIAAGWDTSVEALEAHLAGEPFDHDPSDDEAKATHYRDVLG